MPLREGDIVVGVDGSPSSTAAVEWAAHEAEMRNLPLKLVHVVPPIVVPAGPWAEVPFDYSGLLAEEARRVMEDAHKIAVESASPDGTAQMTSEVLHAPAVPSLVGLSEQAGMLVVGCRGRGKASGALLGSVSSGVVHHAHCPVAVIHDEKSHPGSSRQAPVVVGVDGSPASELATEIAFDEASRRGVGLVALHAWTDMGPLEFPSINWAPIEWANIKDSEEEVLAERLGGWQESYPDVAVERVVVADRPTPRLLEKAETAQLVVVGSHGRGGFPGMQLGSVSRAVVNCAQVPVIVARMPHT